MTLSDPQSPISPEDSPAPEPQSPAVPQFAAQPLEPVEPHANVPEDIRVPWGGGELLLFLGFALGSLFVMQIILQLFMLVHFHMSLEQIIRRFKTDAALAVGFQAAWSAVLFLFFWFAICIYHRSAFWSSLRWRLLRPRVVSPAAVYLTCIFSGIALEVAVSIASHFYGEKPNLPIEQLFRTRADVLWLTVFGICVAPFFEETLFRGYLYPVFARKWGVPAGILITGVLFGSVHAAQLWGGWAQIALLMFVGIVLTFARARTGSVLASYLIHLSYNSFLFSGFYFTTHGLKNIPPLH